MDKSDKTEELRKATAAALQEGEELLWAQHRQKCVDKNCVLCAICGLLFLGLAIACLVHIGSFDDADTKKLTGLGVFSLISLIGLGTSAATYYVHSRTIYALTNLRALVFQPGFPTSPLVYAAPLTQKLVHHIVHRRNGTADYLMYNVEIGNHSSKEGFRYVREPEKLEAAFTRAGISLPVPGVKLPVSYRIQYLPPAGVAIAGWLVGALLILGLLLPLTTQVNGADLYLRGERAEALIIGHEKRTKREGRRAKRNVTRYYPILSYLNEEGKTCRGTDLHGDKKPDWQPGEMVDIFYDPAEPKRVIRKDTSVLLIPGLVLMIGLWMLWRCYKSTRRLREKNASHCRILTAQEI